MREPRHATAGAPRDSWVDGLGPANLAAPPIRDDRWVSSRAILAERLTAQGLSGAPERDPLAVAERLLAIQGQDPRGARLAIRARTVGLSAADVDRALTDDRSLLITWLNRGTLHLVRSQDYPWLQTLTAPPLRAANARRLAQEGVTPDAAERGVKVIERSVAEEGPLTRIQLRERLDSAGVRTEGQALVHLLSAGQPARHHRARADVRQAPCLRVGPGLARPCAAGRARRGTRRAGPSLPPSVTVPQATATSPSGRGCRSATLAAGLEAIASELVERDDGLLDLAASSPDGGDPTSPSSRRL